MALAKTSYGLAELLPSSEQYRLTSQLLRAAVSVPANIAEGHARGTRKDCANFTNIARGSLAETDTCLRLLVDVELQEPEAVAAALALSEEISKMLAALLNRLGDQPPSSVSL